MNQVTYPRISIANNQPLIPKIAEKRLNNFIKSDYVSQGISTLVDRAIAGGEEHVIMHHWPAPGDSRPFFDKATAQLGVGEAVRRLSVGDVFGPPWSNHWVRVQLIIPESWRHARLPVHFAFDASCEAMVYSEDAAPLQGLTGSSISTSPAAMDVRRIEHVIPKAHVVTGHYTIIIEVSCSSPFEVGMFDIGFSASDMTRTFPLVFAHLVQPNEAVRGMCSDFRILQQVSQSTENHASDLPRRALKAANSMIDAFHRVHGDVQDPDLLLPVIAKCRAIAASVLGSIESPPVMKPKVWAIGHCHIDCAWLWRYTQAQQKVVRSWTTQCDLMDRYPKHHFAASSALQYYWLEQYYPMAFERVKAYVMEGRFHPVGGAWVEPDCNITSGESLIRQHLHGQAYFESRFGIRCREAWLPDTFGFGPQVPQILRGCGIQYFTTQKLRYNINPLPYTTFNWAALDGTQVLSHITPADTYKGQCDFKELEKCVWNNKNIADVAASMLIFGNGGAGGGPTSEMLEKLERLGSLAQQDGLAPSVAITSPADFFDHLLVETEGGQKLPTWRGELYLEFHRGTYSTQEIIKRGNRTLERLLLNLEYFATLACISSKEYNYPRSKLEEIWRDTMLNQFHDVLPGTSVSLVIEDVMEIHQRRARQLEELIEEALLALYPESKPLTTQDTGSEHKISIDPLRLSRRDLIDLAGESHVVSTDRNGTGLITPFEDPGEAPRAYETEGEYVLENADFRLTLTNGRITSFVDRSQDRELVQPGPGAETGGLTLYEDYPLEWDAWDMEIYHLQSYQHIEFDDVQPRASGHRAELVATADFGNSKAVVTFSLDASIPNVKSFLRIHAHVDWQAEHQVLKFVLPLDIQSAHATYGTQFGIIQRPTHRNTTYDQARFEVCGHMFSDLSETGYGVAIASDKYGYSVENNVMRLTLLRASKSPDPNADRGIHDIEFAVMPHTGSLQESNIYQRAMALQNPVYLRSLSSPLIPALPSFVIRGDQAQTVVLETIKMAEASDSVILRMYESLGRRSTGDIVVSHLDLQSAQWVNFLEEPLDDTDGVELKEENGAVTVRINLRAFEIKTLMLSLTGELSRGWQMLSPMVGGAR